MRNRGLVLGSAFLALAGSLGACSSTTESASPISRDSRNCELIRVRTYEGAASLNESEEPNGIGVPAFTGGGFSSGCWIDPTVMPEKVVAQALEKPVAEGYLNLSQASAIFDGVVFNLDGVPCLDVGVTYNEDAMDAINVLVAADAVPAEYQCQNGDDDA